MMTCYGLSLSYGHGNSIFINISWNCLWRVVKDYCLKMTRKYLPNFYLQSMEWRGLVNISLIFFLYIKRGFQKKVEIYSLKGTWNSQKGFSVVLDRHGLWQAIHVHNQENQDKRITKLLRSDQIRAHSRWKLAIYLPLSASSFVR